MALFFTLSLGQSAQVQAENMPFSKNLRFGVQSEDVKRLQEYLNSHSFPLANSGFGSVGHETTYFGPKTRAALMRFQQHFAEAILKPLGRIHATGNFYTSTRNFINSLLLPVITHPAARLIIPFQETKENQESSQKIQNEVKVNNPLPLVLGGPSHSSAPIRTYRVGGSVSGLSGAVVLQNNGTGNLTINANGAFTLATSIVNGSTYSVTVLTQPDTQTCAVTNGSGTVNSANITNVTVTCSTNSYTVGGTVSGLTGSVVLQNNGTDNLTLNTDGPLTFSTPVAEGSTYDVTVLTQPDTQTCTVENGGGTMGGANVTNVSVTCSTNAYTVGGSVSGLTGSVVLQNNGADNLTLNTNGALTFSTPVAEGSPYDVMVLTQPENQTCTVNNGSGTMGGANVTNVSVTCSTNTYTVGGTVTGLVLGSAGFQNNGGDDLIMDGDGSFTFTTHLFNSASYSVTIFSEPQDQTCEVTNGAGTISGSNVTNVQVVCTLIPHGGFDPQA